MMVLSLFVCYFFFGFLAGKKQPVRQSVRVSQSRTSPFMAYLNHSSIGANPVEKVPEFLASSCPNADSVFKEWRCAHTENY